jgi:large subunit ribosomal protein L21
MYAIVEIAGKQFKITKDQYIYTPKLDAAEGSSVTFEQVLLLGQENNTTIGEPIVAGAKIIGKVLTHVRDDKVLVFKKKRRKGYKKLQGHRQDYTKVLIENILTK